MILFIHNADTALPWRQFVSCFKVTFAYCGQWILNWYSCATIPGTVIMMHKVRLVEKSVNLPLLHPATQLQSDECPALQVLHVGHVTQAYRQNAQSNANTLSEFALFPRF
jgi:hypothetical protein